MKKKLMNSFFLDTMNSPEIIKESEKTPLQTDVTVKFNESIFEVGKDCLEKIEYSLHEDCL